MQNFMISLCSTLCYYLLDGYVGVRKSFKNYLLTFIFIWLILFGCDKLQAHNEVWLQSDLKLIESFDPECLTPAQRREIMIKALDHRKEAVRAFKDVQWYANQFGLLNDDAADELVRAAIAGICTRPYQWSAVVATLIIFSLEHGWSQFKVWTQIESKMNEGKYHVEMFEFYKQILDNG